MEKFFTFYSRDSALNNIIAIIKSLQDIKSKSIKLTNPN